MELAAEGIIGAPICSTMSSNQLEGAGYWNSLGAEIP